MGKTVFLPDDLVELIDSKKLGDDERWVNTLRRLLELPVKEKQSNIKYDMSDIPVGYTKTFSSLPLSYWSVYNAAKRQEHRTGSTFNVVHKGNHIAVARTS
jgi:hypothetical protein